MSSEEERRKWKNSKIAQTYLENFSIRLEGENCSKGSRYKKTKISQFKIINHGQSSINLMGPLRGKIAPRVSFMIPADIKRK